MTGLGAPFVLAGTAPDRKWQRVTGAVLVLLLHLLGLLAALHAISRPGVGHHLEHELTFVLRLC